MASLGVTGSVFVSDQPPAENRQQANRKPWTSLELHVRFPERVGVAEVKMLREQSELLQAQLKRMSSTVSAKLAKVGGKAKQGEGPAISMRLLDAAGMDLPLDGTCTSSWCVAKTLLVVGLQEENLQLPVFWNPPQVLALRVSAEVSIVGVPLLATAELRGCRADECAFLWQRQRAGDNAVNAEGSMGSWEDICDSALYVPSPDDEGAQLRVCCAPPAPGDRALVVAKSIVQGSPKDSFRWEPLPPRLNAPVIRLVTYNVLADAYAGSKGAKDKGLFPYCAEGALEAPSRRQRIIRDLLKLDGDVMGLQEVDAGQLSTMSPLRVLGWDSFYSRKAGGAADGCALLWRRDRFEVEEEPFQVRLGGTLEELQGLLDDAAVHAIRENAPTRSVLAAVTTVAQGVLLRDRAVEGRRLLVANTHLYYHANANHIRLLQLHMLLNDLQRRRKLAEKTFGGKIAVVVLGDLNARKGTFGPSDIGKPPQAAYRLVRDGVILPSDTDWEYSAWCPDDWRTGKGSEGEELMRLQLTLPVPLTDPNDHIEVTNFTETFQECLDYTLLDADELRVVRTIEQPPVEHLRAEVALPNTMFPSDHVPVVVDATYVCH